MGGNLGLSCLYLLISGQDLRLYLRLVLACGSRRHSSILLVDLPYLTLPIKFLINVRLNLLLRQKCLLLQLIKSSLILLHSNLLRIKVHTEVILGHATLSNEVHQN